MRQSGARVFQLGALPPETENPLRDMLAQIDALQQEALADIRTLSDEGHDISSYKAEYDAFETQSAMLGGEFTTLDEGHIPSWKGRANGVVAGLMDLLNRLGTAKQGGFELAGKKGLLWGLGVAVVVAGTSYFVWQHRRRRRGYRRYHRR
jgi:hypothetical protein